MIARTLYRPVGPEELKLIAATSFREFPPRLPEQPIFYPVLNEEYARADCAGLERKSFRRRLCDAV